MTRRDWWLGVALLAAAIVFHAVFPRYEVLVIGEARVPLRVDRWTGSVTVAPGVTVPNAR